MDIRAHSYFNLGVSRKFNLGMNINIIIESLLCSSRFKHSNPRFYLDTLDMLLFFWKLHSIL